MTAQTQTHDAQVQQDIRTWQSQLARSVLRALTIVGPLAAIAGSYFAYSRQVLWVIPLYWVAYGALVLITFWRQIPYSVQAGAILALIYAMAILDFLSDGRGGSARVFLIIVPFIARIFFGRREGFISLLVILLTMAVMAAAFSAGMITSYEEIVSTDLAGWISNTFVLLMLSVFVVVSLNHLIPPLSGALARSRALAQENESHRKELEGWISTERAVVEQYVGHMDRLSAGNLSARITLESSERDLDDPLVVLGRRLNEITAGLQRMISQVREASYNLNSAAAEITAATAQQAAGASEQSAAIAQASSTIDEVRTIAEQTAQRAEGVADLAQQVSRESRSGQGAVSDTVAGVEEVKTKVDSIAHEVLALSEQAQAIGGIINTVSQLATQSNMLALNASVEAARAGEAGRGFAVVAAEVRSLAQQSKAATEQVRELLTEIQRGVNTAVMATEEGIKGANTGIHLTSQAGHSIEQLAQGVNQSTQAAQQIAAAASQQQVGMEQIAQAMDHINQVTAQSVSGARQVEQSARDLSILAGQLRELVEQYQL